MTATSESDPFDALLAWLILLPALALAVPAGLLHHVPTTTSAGLGWTLIAFLPAAAVLALRRKPVAFRGSSLLLAVLVLASFWATRAGDPFEARRTVLALTLAFALTLGGASLGPEGRRVLLRGSALLTVFLVAVAALQPAPHPGVLGNTGHTAQAALPGAIAGLVVARTSLGAMRWVGYAASAAFVMYAATTPVLAGLAAFGAGAAGLLLASAGRRETALTARAGLLFLIAGAATFGVAGVLGGDEDTPASGDARLGGIEFRQRTWTAAVTSLLPEHLVWGVGPGQFEREFPPHRDPQERRLSSHGGAEPTPVQVEHAHNDVLQGVLDFGLVGGAAWLAFLGLVLVGAWQRLRSPDLFEVGLGACALGGWAAAWLNAPLLASPAAPAVLWPLFGAVLSRPAARTTLAMALPGLAGLLLLLRADTAWSFTRHGAALAQLAETELFEYRGAEGLRASEVAPHLRAALDACPDSPVALEKQNEMLRVTGATAADRERVLARLLEARPYQLGPRTSLGILYAGLDRYHDAKVELRRALAIAPEDWRVWHNLFLVAVDSYDDELLFEAAAALAADEGRVAGLLRPMALRLVIAGRHAVGSRLLKELDPESDVTGLNEAYALRRAGASSGELADAAQVAYHQLQARQHVADGQFDTAVVMFRQALQTSRDYEDLPGGDTLLKLELAAALAGAGRLDEATEQVELARPGLLHWANVTEAAGEALKTAELFRTF